jgi:hypothetical protein
MWTFLFNVKINTVIASFTFQMGVELGQQFRKLTYVWRNCASYTADLGLLGQ